MRRFNTVLLTVAFSLCAQADGLYAVTDRTRHATLRERALETSFAQFETRPTGQCIYTCDDRMITLKRCPDGECPEYDCKTGQATCRSR